MPFNILNNAVEEITEADKSLEMKGQIESLLKSSKVVPSE